MSSHDDDNAARPTLALPKNMTRANTCGRCKYFPTTRLIIYCRVLHTCSPFLQQSSRPLLLAILLLLLHFRHLVRRVSHLTSSLSFALCSSSYLPNTQNTTHPMPAGRAPELAVFTPNGVYLSSRIRYSWSCTARVPLSPLHKGSCDRILLSWSCRGPLVVADQVSQPVSIRYIKQQYYCCCQVVLVSSCMFMTSSALCRDCLASHII